MEMVIYPPENRSANHYQEGAVSFQFVPGKFKTVWAEPGSARAWRSTGLDINGYQILKDQKDSRNNGGGGAT
jgi:hypothetical protein